VYCSGASRYGPYVKNFTGLKPIGDSVSHHSIPIENALLFGGSFHFVSQAQWEIVIKVGQIIAHRLSAKQHICLRSMTGCQGAEIQTMTTYYGVQPLSVKGVH
jgi:hypothetical protein